MSYELEITIGEIVFKDLFRVVEKAEIFYIFRGVDSLKKYIIEFKFLYIDDILYTIDQNNNHKKLNRYLLQSLS